MATEVAANIATVVIDGPKNNLLNPAVMQKVAADLRAADADEAVTGILLTGAGDDFCGGLDLASIHSSDDSVEFARNLADLLKVFPTLGKPVAAVVNGDAVASGASLVAASDYAVSIESARIGTYEVSVGVWPVVAQVPLIKRIGARAAMENVGTGDPFTPQRALEVGLVNGLAADAAAASAVAGDWLTRAARAAAVYGGRLFFYEIADLSYDEALERAFVNFAAQYE